MQRVNETLSISVATIVVAALFSPAEVWVIVVALMFALFLFSLQASLFSSEKG